MEDPRDPEWLVEIKGRGRRGRTIVQWEDDLDRLIREVEQLRELLARLEWAGSTCYGSPQEPEWCCPACYAIKGQPHRKDCRLAAALNHKQP